MESSIDVIWGTPILKSPTVGAIIELLSKYPKDLPFTMMDADTNWIIDTIHLTVSDDGIEFFGIYDEMKDGK